MRNTLGGATCIYMCTSDAG